MAQETQSVGSREDPRGRGAPAWYLVVALDAARPFAAAARLFLGGVSEVSVGRGAARAVKREGSSVRLDLDDPFQSEKHLRLMRSASGWRLVDDGSKNGTRVRGVRAREAELVPGDVIEAGATFLVIQRSVAAPNERVLGEGESSLFRTLHAPLEAALEVTARVAPTTLPVLVRGESGTGKELVARAIHELSGRRGRLVAVNCGALPAGIAEAELFGARRGAFSGAVEDRAGLIRTAEGGTLFLDEVVELPLSAQAALLRVLQEGELRQLGSNQTTLVDVRIISATHRDVDVLVARDEFRRDLAARLRGHVVSLPALRERREDLGLILAELLRRIGFEGRLERAAARALLAHEWPGNIRELEHALRAAVALAGDADELTVEHLPESVLAAPSSAAPRPGDERRALIVRLLGEHGGNLSAVARALGTSRSQLRRLAARFGIALGRDDQDS